MKWIGISGSWRATSEEVENDVREAVREIINRGDGIVTGGGLNVDYFAINEALKLDSEAKQIKAFITLTLPGYAAHYRKRAAEGVITEKQAEDLIAQMTLLKEKNPEALIENKENKVAEKRTYFNNNSDIADASDELLAFQVNHSEGTQDTIDKVKKDGKPVHVKHYNI